MDEVSLSEGTEDGEESLTERLVMADSYFFIGFAIVGVLALGLTALILSRSDPKPTRSMWVIAVATVIVGLIIAFFGAVIAINLIIG